MGRILIVDDVAASRDAMARLLKKQGYETASAANGEEAISQLRKADTDLILLDHLMPKVDGLTFLAQIRRFPKWKSMPVIMMTGLNDQAHRMKAAALGVSEYVLKADVPPSELMKRIVNLVPIPAAAGA